MQKYIYIARQLSIRGAMTLRELCDGWAEHDLRGRPMASSTFYDNRRLLADRFNIRLEQDKSRRYRLVQQSRADYALLRRLCEGAGESETVLSTSEVWRDVLDEGRRDFRLVRMSYASLRRPAYETLLAPYSFHSHQGRDYVIGHSSLHQAQRTFALDRIVAAQLLTAHFAPPERAAFFTHSVGAMSGEIGAEQAETVRIRANGYLVAFLRAAPLHPSQEEVEAGVFQWRVAHDDELVRQLLAFGTNAEVIAPPALRREMRETIERMRAMYAETL